MSAAPSRHPSYVLTVKDVLRLRVMQREYQRIASDTAIKQSAREAAAREVARIEGEIRG